MVVEKRVIKSCIMFFIAFLWQVSLTGCSITDDKRSEEKYTFIIDSSTFSGEAYSIKKQPSSSGRVQLDIAGEVFQDCKLVIRSVENSDIDSNDERRSVVLDLKRGRVSKKLNCLFDRDLVVLILPTNIAQIGTLKIEAKQLSN